MEPLKRLPGMVNLLMFKSFQNALFELPGEDRVYVFRNIPLSHGHVSEVMQRRKQHLAGPLPREPAQTVAVAMDVSVPFKLVVYCETLLLTNASLGKTGS
jgi:hypothetical protein